MNDAKKKNKTADFIQMKEREKAIFYALMSHYILNPEPVGSRKLAREFNLSPATIRNIMADLEEYGLLEQPHISSGRIPSDEGYRFYVNEVAEKAQDEKILKPNLKKQIIEGLSAGRGIDQTLHQVSDLLSELSRYAGVVVLPRIVNVKFKRIQFVSISDHRILALFVTPRGIVHNKIVNTDKKFVQNELDRMSNLLNDRFEDMTLRQIRKELTEMLEEEERHYNSLLNSATKICEMALDQSDMPNERVFVEGTMNIFELPEFKDLRKLQEMFRALNEQQSLIRLLDRCLDSDGVSVILGDEIEMPEISDMSVVTSKYLMDDETMGSLGVIGPKRMPYREVISLVAFVSHVLSTILKDNDLDDDQINSNRKDN